MPIANIIRPAGDGISRAELAYRAIRGAILSNHLRRGEHLGEESIAQHLGISRTPVREALGRLRTEGLVKEVKPRGYVVSPVTATDVFHVYDVREELEGLCLRLAARRIMPYQLFQLSTIFERMGRNLGDAREFSRLNVEFHAVIYEATDNPVLQKIMEDLMAVVERFPVSAYEVEGRAEDALAEHEEILKALTEHDSEAAEAAVDRHLQHGRKARLTAMQRYALETEDLKNDDRGRHPDGHPRATDSH